MVYALWWMSVTTERTRYQSHSHSHSRASDIRAPAQRTCSKKQFHQKLININIVSYPRWLTCGPTLWLIMITNSQSSSEIGRIEMWICNCSYLPIHTHTHTRACARAYVQGAPIKLTRPRHSTASLQTIALCLILTNWISFVELASTKIQEINSAAAVTKPHAKRCRSAHPSYRIHFRRQPGE